MRRARTQRTSRKEKEFQHAAILFLSCQHDILLLPSAAKSFSVSPIKSLHFIDSHWYPYSTISVTYCHFHFHCLLNQQERGKAWHSAVAQWSEGQKNTVKQRGYYIESLKKVSQWYVRAWMDAYSGVADKHTCQILVIGLSLYVMTNLQ